MGEVSIAVRHQIKGEALSSCRRCRQLISDAVFEVLLVQAAQIKEF
jgi:hypothetical protein